MHPLLKSLNRKVKRASETEEDQKKLVKRSLEAIRETILFKYDYIEKVLQGSDQKRVAVEIHFKQNSSWILRVDLYPDTDSLTLIHEQRPVLGDLLLIDGKFQQENVESHLQVLRDLIEDEVLFLDGRKSPL